MTYYRVLPLHPSIKPFESLTGYITSLAELNGISSVDGVSKLFFPDQSRRITRELSDFAALQSETLSVVTNRTKQELLGTTFHYVGAKFGRSTHPQALSRFLSGSISNGLRYCPRCIRKYGFYSLIWRIKAVTGCPEHNCHLLDKCGHCGKTVALFKAPFRIGFCSHCSHDLRNCDAKQLLPEDALEARKKYDDLAYLLFPQDWESGAKHIVKTLGRYLMFQRRKAGLNGTDIADELQTSQSVIEGIERSNTNSRGCSFIDYVKYADYFGLNFRELFDIALQSSQDDWCFAAVNKQHRLFSVKQAAIELIRAHTKVTYALISLKTGIPQSTLKWDEDARNLIKAYKDEPC